MKLLYSYMRRLCAYITDRLYQFKRFLQLSIDGLGLSCPVFTKVTGILPVALVCFHFVCLAQSSRESGMTEVNTGLQYAHKPIYNYSLYDAVWSEPIVSERYYSKAIQRYPKADLHKYPMEMYKIDMDRIPWIKEGELLPDEVLDLPLWVVNDEYGRDTITLRTEMDKEWIVLELWFESCPPCIRYMNRWESLKSEIGDRFNYIGLFTSFYPHRAAFEARKHGWGSPQVIGQSMKILKTVFTRNGRLYGSTFWIKNGVYVGSSHPYLLDGDDDRKILTGELSDIPEHARWSFNQ